MEVAGHGEWFGWRNVAFGEARFEFRRCWLVSDDFIGPCVWWTTCECGTAKSEDQQAGQSWAFHQVGSGVGCCRVTCKAGWLMKQTKPAAGVQVNSGSSGQE
jgi:hypothetical protein